MNLQQQINNDLKEAIKNKEAEKLSTLRMLSTAIMNYSVERMKKGEGLSDDEVIKIVSREIKQRKDAIIEYEKGGRKELAAKEKRELGFLQVYMPEQMSADEIRKAVEEVAASAGEGANMGAIMGQVMGKLKGRADGNVVRKIVEELLK